MSSPLVSVIVPAYQRPHLLEGAVESALGAGEFVEVIVVNDASPEDETPRVCERMANRWPNVRVIHHEKNTGVAGARNTGLGVARGEFVSFVDLDDRRLPNSFASQIAALERVPDALFCYGRSQLATGDDMEPEYVSPRNLPELPQGDIWEFLMEFCPFAPIATLVRRRAFDEVGLMDTSLTKADDWDLWLRLSAVAPVVAVEEIVGIYRMAHSSAGQQTTDLPAVFKQCVRVHQKALQSERAARLSPKRRRELQRVFSETCVYLLFLAALNMARNLKQKRRPLIYLSYAARISPLLSLRIAAHLGQRTLRGRPPRLPAPVTRL